MSTKIYNGYKLPKQDMISLLAFCKELSVEIQQQKIDSFYQLLAENSVRALTYSALGVLKKEEYFKDAKNHKVITWERHLLGKRIDERKPHERDPGYDFGFNVMFFPMKNQILCMTFCEDSKMIKIWEKKAQNYHYQDQTDRPESITSREWNRREKDWNKVLGGDGWGKPIDNGFEFTFTDENVTDKIFYYNLNMDSIISKVAPFEERVGYAAKQLFMDRYITEAAKELPEEERNKWSSTSKYYWKAMDLIKKK